MTLPIYPMCGRVYIAFLFNIWGAPDMILCNERFCKLFFKKKVLLQQQQLTWGSLWSRALDFLPPQFSLHWGDKDDLHPE